MAQIRDYRKLAHDIICEVGGKENIVNATRCATRLRLVLKEEPEQAKEKVAAMAGVITVVENSGQFQVVIGTHVGEVYDAVAEELHLDTENLQVEQPKQSVMNKVIATMSAVFAPFVYILAAAGLLQGALILVNMAVPYYTGLSLPFVASIVIGTIQLGATVDYAILMTSRYQKERINGKKKMEEIRIAHETSMQSIITSGLSFFAATIGIAIYSNIDMISAICTLLARGAVISTVAVIFILPAMFMIFDKLICKTTLKMGHLE